MTFFENKQYSGYGQKVLTGINIPKGAYQASMSHKGNSNFAIWLYTGSGSRKQLLVNEIGNYQGTVAIEDKIENGYIIRHLYKNTKSKNEFKLKTGK